MFRRISTQSSLFGIETILPDILPSEDWCYIYRDQIYPIIDEDKFKDLYDDNNGKGGRPNKSIKTEISICPSIRLDDCNQNAFIRRHYRSHHFI
ncbi:MAG: hypothetical protein ACUZ8O_03480 [Candidatus Anammoxibacter sp.]